VIAIGFDENFNGFVEISETGSDGKRSVIMGSDIENIVKERDETHLFEKAPENVAFIQCYGSRDKKENAMYCSRVCCAYTSRAAKLLKQYYPECNITFFYMEMQQVKCGNYFDELKQLGVHFVKCRPIKITTGNPACVTFDDPETGKREKLAFELVVLADGIRPADEAAKIAEICGLNQAETGFLKYVTDISDANQSGVYITGCAKGPAKIEEVYA
jgi:heterodisulfide reductase subunit A